MLFNISEVYQAIIILIEYLNINLRFDIAEENKKLN